MNFLSFIQDRPFFNKELNKIMTNAGWLFFEKILRAVIGFFVGVWVAKFLGPEQFGILSYATAFVAFVGVLISLHCSGLVIREIVNNPDRKDEILGTVFIFKIFAAIIGITLCISVVLFLRHNDRMTLTLIIILSAGMFFQIFDVIDLWNQSQVKSKYTVTAKSTAFLLISLFKIGLIISKAHLIYFALAGALEIIIGAIGLIVMYKIGGEQFSKLKFKLSFGKQLFYNGWPLFIQGFAVISYMRVDKIMLREMTNAYQVGIYSVAVQLTEALYFVPLVITASFFPAIIKSKQLGQQIYMDRIQKLFDLMIWMALLSAIFITLISDNIISVLFGKSYEESGQILALQIWMVCSIFFGVSRQKWLIVENYLKDGLCVDMTGLTLNIICNYFLIPQYGAIGASVASLITSFSSHLIVAIFSKPIRLSIKMYIRSLTLPVRYLKNYA